MPFTLRGVRGRGLPWRGRGFRRGWCRGCRRNPFRSCRCWWRWWKVWKVWAMLPCGRRWRPFVCAAGSCAWVFTIPSWCILAACLEVSTHGLISPSAFWTICWFDSTRCRRLDASRSIACGPEERGIALIVLSLFWLLVIAYSLEYPILYSARFSHFNLVGGLSFSFRAVRREGTEWPSSGPSAGRFSAWNNSPASRRGARIVKGPSGWVHAYAVKEDHSSEPVCAHRFGLELYFCV